MTKSLMPEAENKALELDCHSLWLDTSSPKAMQFYAALGYEVFGALENKEDQQPPTHRRWFMRKAINLNP